MSDELFVVRLWDGMDGAWTDVTEPVSREAAQEKWDELTGNGTHHHNFDEIDYYYIFPADTRMLYSAGNEMFRVGSSCPCGRPLHYSDPHVRELVEQQIADLGEKILMTVAETGRKFLVPRHYIALHGIAGPRTGGDGGAVRD